ncbi:GH92 family glycosyl hydrolase [Pedobacter antarcticus]|uniref:GH92 family glycosyl hydrolase n=1 Tax=Pedobacter antarcticus TaxID=34086 RepID=UPI00292D5BD5|nr:GH92 family glycosyl hydrolase [Pedobacter antarcticus]
MKKLFSTVLLYFSVFPFLFGQEKTLSPADYVNPMIGASTSEKAAGVYHGLGKTFPGATTPYGMVQVSPNTITGGDNGSGYSDEHTSIEGFAFTQMSGVGWYGDLGNFLVMPTVGKLRTSAGTAEDPESGYRSAYDKSSERAEAGYYSVRLAEGNIKAEATAAQRSGMLRFTFPEKQQARIQIDLARRVGGTSTLQYVKVVNDNTIEGWMKCTPEGGGWGNGAGKGDYTVYFYAQFSKPLKKFGFWSADIPDDWKRKLEDVTSVRYQKRIADAQILTGINEKQGKHLGFFTEFDTNPGDQVILRSGISFVSIEGARNNLNADIKHWDFDEQRNAARTVWNKSLSKIKIKGGTDQEKRVFYTAMYHTQIDPRIFSDADGKYTGGDGEIHQAKGFTKRTIFSGWDVFRSQMPLQTVINPSLVSDMLNSLITLADEKQEDYLERWEFLNAYSGCMIGSPAVSLMTDAYMKGIRNFNVNRGYQLAVSTVEKNGNGERGFSTQGAGISNTLENAYAEWCVSELARDLNKTGDQQKYLKRSGSYKNIWDAEHSWFRPKKDDGSWEAWPAEGRMKQSYGAMESSPYQQGWFVPHDIDGMIKLMGGREKTLADLTSFFENVPEDMMWNDYYNHANEPVHHVPFLFNRLGTPWLTQKWTRAICSRAYHNAVTGLVGNEDVGQMSAWYVLAASGFHPITPGSSRYELTSPVFNQVDIQLDSAYAKGSEFSIIANGNSPENIYIQSATLNGKPHLKSYIDHKDIMAGGKLILQMGSLPNKAWGIN